MDEPKTDVERINKFLKLLPEEDFRDLLLEDLGRETYPPYGKRLIVDYLRASRNTYLQFIAHTLKTRQNNFNTALYKLDEFITSKFFTDHRGIWKLLPELKNDPTDKTWFTEQDALGNLIQSTWQAYQELQHEIYKYLNDRTTDTKQSVASVHTSNHHINILSHNRVEKIEFGIQKLLTSASMVCSAFVTFVKRVIDRIFQSLE